MITASLDSKTLRKKLRSQRQSLSESQQQKHAKLAQQHLISFLLSQSPTKTQSKPFRIAFFIAQDSELETRLAIKMLWESTPHHIFLPVLQTQPNELMCFAEYNKNSVMKPNKFGILEPEDPQQRLQTGNTFDIVFTPLVGFDSNGNRLGMGGGYYDRTFQFKQLSSKIAPPLLIGWAHSCQHVTQLPTNPWDVPLNGVITETGFTDFST